MKSVAIGTRCTHSTPNAATAIAPAAAPMRRRLLLRKRRRGTSLSSTAVRRPSKSPEDRSITADTTRMQLHGAIGPFVSRTLPVTPALYRRPTAPPALRQNALAHPMPPGGPRVTRGVADDMRSRRKHPPPLPRGGLPLTLRFDGRRRCLSRYRGPPRAPAGDRGPRPYRDRGARACQPARQGVDRSEEH